MRPIETSQSLKPSASSGRLLGLAVGYGALAGAIAAVTFLAMKGLEHLLWSHTDARWYIFLVVLAGGLLLAWLRTKSTDSGLDEQLANAEDPTALHRRKTAFLAASAIIAVGFGGAIGPEAGLVAVVAELSVMVSRRIARSAAERKVIGTAGNAAALAGLYGSPPGGAAYGDDTLSPSKWTSIAAGISGFLGFLTVVKLAGLETHGLELPELPQLSLLTLLAAVVPAVLASLVALGYARFRAGLESLFSKLGPGWRQTLIGSVLLAVLLACFPLLRFSGHSDFPVLTEQAELGAWWFLVGLAIAKALATALSLAAGWRGGEFFPLAFVGAAVGAACASVVPGLDLGTAIVAGMAAAATVTLGKPLAVLLIVILMVPTGALAPVAVAVLAGIATLRISGHQPGHH